MPIHHAIWKVGATPASLAVARLASEQALEDMILRDPGRQKIAPFTGRIDHLPLVQSCRSLRK